MNPDLVNLYIETMLAEIGENAKTRILLLTQQKNSDTLNAQLNARVAELEAQIVELQEKIQSSQEKLNKKKSKEVNTSDDTF